MTESEIRMAEAREVFGRINVQMTNMLRHQALKDMKIWRLYAAQDAGFETVEEHDAHLKLWSTPWRKFLKIIGRGPEKKPSVRFVRVIGRGNSVRFPKIVRYENDQ